MGRSRITLFVLAVLVTAVLCNSTNGDVTTKASEAKCNYMYQVKADKLPPCILANMTISLNAVYKTKDNKDAVAKYDVPNNKSVTVSGICSPVMSELVLTWGEEKTQNSVKFVLLNNYTVFSVVHVAFNVSIADPNAAVDRLVKGIDLDDGLFSGNMQNISVCKNVAITIQESNMKVSDVKLIAYNSDDKYCERKESDTPCSTENVLPYDISSTDNKISTLAAMSVSFEIPYTQTNGKVQIYKQNFTKAALIDNVKYNINGKKQNQTADLHWYDNGNKFTLSIAISTDDNGVAYIDNAGVDITIDKKNLESAKDNVSRKGNITLRMFPVAYGNGLYSCKTGNVLRFGDIKLTIANVLFAPFHTEKNFKVTQCNPETALNERMFNYVVRDQNSDIPCIIGNMTIGLNVTYNKKDKTKDTKTIEVPWNATTTGSCDEYMPYMDLSWPGSKNENKKDKKSRLQIGFYRTSEQYYVDYVKADIYNDQEIFQDTVETGEWLHSMSTTPLKLLPNKMVNGFFKCSDISEAMINNSTKIKISNVMLMAFNDQEDISIKSIESNCHKDNKTDTDKNNTITGVPGYKYSVFPKNSKIPCTLANMDITLNIHYATKTGTGTKEVKVPTNATSNGTCGDEVSTLNIQWPTENPKNEVNLTFNMLNSRFYLHRIETSIDTTNFTDTKGEKFKGQIDNLMIFSTDASNTYKCESQEQVTGNNFSATFNNVILIVFNKDADYTKRSEENCSGANVGAIVGGLIGGLLVVGVIGYVVYRYCWVRY
ncbi:uncharacterized protein LOC144475916 [Augochlora pura]